MRDKNRKRPNIEFFAMAKIESVILDWGGVLIEYPAPGRVRYCAEALGVAEK